MMPGEWSFSDPVEETLPEPSPVPRRPLMTSTAPLSSERDYGVRRSPVRVAPMQVDFSQAAARTQRLKGWGDLVHYLDFDVVAEVRDVCGPLAVEIVELLSSSPFFRDGRAAEAGQDGLLAPGFHVVRIAETVHRMRIDLTDLVARRGGLSPEARARMAAVVRDAAHTSRPEVDNEALKSGSWVDCFAAHVEPLRSDLLEVVARRPTGVVSEFDEALSAVFRGPDGFDQAVRELERRVAAVGRAKAAWRRGQREAEAMAADRERKRLDASLSRLGLS